MQLESSKQIIFVRVKVFALRVLKLEVDLEDSQQEADVNRITKLKKISKEVNDEFVAHKVKIYSKILALKFEAEVKKKTDEGYPEAKLQKVIDLKEEFTVLFDHV